MEGSHGFEPNALKYMWPGVIAQKVEDAVHGECSATRNPREGPRASNTLCTRSRQSVTGLTIDDEMVIVPPLVVKPDPLKETEAIRTALHAAATEARTGAGRPGVNSKSHYRLYCYTDPTIGETRGSAGERRLGSGHVRLGVLVLSSGSCTGATTATSRPRTAHPLPTDLEPADVAAGAAVDPGGLDGLYAYTAAERLAAAEWLFDTLHDEVRDQAGWLGEFLTDAADDVANQMINAFVTDDADARNSQKWRDVGPATAVSPDNLLWWDGPDGDGLYGYAEPLIYREPRKETYTVSRWKQVLVYGRLSGQVTNDDGQPVAGALVQLYDGKSDYTRQRGRYASRRSRSGNMRSIVEIIDGSLTRRRWRSICRRRPRRGRRLAPPATSTGGRRSTWTPGASTATASARTTSPTRAPSTWSSSSAPTDPTNELNRDTSGAASAAWSTTSCAACWWATCSTWRSRAGCTRAPKRPPTSRSAAGASGSPSIRGDGLEVAERPDHGLGEERRGPVDADGEERGEHELGDRSGRFDRVCIAHSARLSARQRRRGPAPVPHPLSGARVGLREVLRHEQRVLEEPAGPSPVIGNDLRGVFGPGLPISLPSIRLTLEREHVDLPIPDVDPQIASSERRSIASPMVLRWMLLSGCTGEPAERASSWTASAGGNGCSMSLRKGCGPETSRAGSIPGKRRKTAPRKHPTVSSTCDSSLPSNC